MLLSEPPNHHVADEVAYWGRRRGDSSWWVSLMEWMGYEVAYINELLLHSNPPTWLFGKNAMSGAPTIVIATPLFFPISAHSVPFSSFLSLFPIHPVGGGEREASAQLINQLSGWGGGNPLENPTRLWNRKKGWLPPHSNRHRVGWE